MAPGPARVQAGNAERVRKPLVEPEAMVDVVDVAGRDSEMCFDLGRREHESILDKLGRSRCEAIADLEQVPDVRLFVLGP